MGCGASAQRPAESLSQVVPEQPAAKPRGMSLFLEDPGLAPAKMTRASDLGAISSAESETSSESGCSTPEVVPRCKKAAFLELARAMEDMQTADTLGISDEEPSSASGSKEIPSEDTTGKDQSVGNASTTPGSFCTSMPFDDETPEAAALKVKPVRRRSHSSMAQIYPVPSCLDMGDDGPVI